ncbi:hypothetical protein ACI8AF_06515 [Blastococcus sp. SYSU D00669]
MHAVASFPQFVRLTVTTTDDVGVQRVLALLTGRGHRFTHLEAEEAGAGRWRLDLDCFADTDESRLLEQRLLRLPSVLAVEVRRRARLQDTA